MPTMTATIWVIVVTAYIGAGIVLSMVGQALFQALAKRNGNSDRVCSVHGKLVADIAEVKTDVKWLRRLRETEEHV